MRGQLPIGSVLAGCRIIELVGEGSSGPSTLHAAGMLGGRAISASVPAT